MEFAPFKSFVDVAFFAKLSEHKLEVAKLSEASVPVVATAEIPFQPSRQPSVYLNADSLAPSEAPQARPAAELLVPGRFTNLNTIEAFKDLDKAAFIRTQAAQIAEYIRSDRALELPGELLTFHAVAFSDLKKYKYYYWFAFPSFSWQSQAVWKRGADPALNRAIAAWLSTPDLPPLSKHVFVVDAQPTGWKVSRLTALKALNPTETAVLGLVDVCTDRNKLPWQLRNVAALLAHKGFSKAQVYLFRDHPKLGEHADLSRWVEIELSDSLQDTAGVLGWERNSQNKLAPKVTDLAALSDPLELANQAVDLNLRLMKWRAAPSIDLDIIKSQKCLLLGAGTLGTYVARGLMAWGVRHITFVDNGTVSYSNPVRQPLYTLQDSKTKAPKAEVAAKALSEIFPGVTASGVALNVPMAGHPVTDETAQKHDYDKLVQLINDHDVVFLLMDSRESRWLPTVVCQGLEKLVINVAIGFDSFLAMRHGLGAKQKHSAESLGCYYCNDVVAPVDSVSRLTLDQMCTVTRPGVAQLASGYAVELFAATLQHPLGVSAPGDEPTVLGPTTHQIRGFLARRETLAIRGEAFKSCSGCSELVVDAWEDQGWNFVKRALNDPAYVTELSGLGALQRETAELDIDVSDDEFE